MSDWTESFRKPFNRQVQNQQKALERGDIEFKKAQNAVKPWPEMKADLENVVFPKLDKWISVLKNKLTGLKFSEIDIKKRINKDIKRLKHMKGVTKWHPYAWFVWFKIGLLVAGIVMIFLIKVTIIVAEVLLFVYLINEWI